MSDAFKPPPARSSKFTLRVYPSERRLLEELAAERGLTTSEVLRELVAAGLTVERGDHGQEQQRVA